MKYTAHLAGGGIVNLEMPEGSDINIFTTWLVDDNGVMVNMTHCAALVPVTALAEVQGEEIDFDGATFIDREGDRWYRANDGQYSTSSNWGHGDFSKETIEKHWGPLRYPK